MTSNQMSVTKSMLYEQSTKLGTSIQHIIYLICTTFKIIYIKQVDQLVYQLSHTHLQKPTLNLKALQGAQQLCTEMQSEAQVVLMHICKRKHSLSYCLKLLFKRTSNKLNILQEANCARLKKGNMMETKRERI